jgi:hypothetical protein
MYVEWDLTVLMHDDAYMYVRMHVCMHACTSFTGFFVSSCTKIYVCMYVCMYVCVHACTSLTGIVCSQHDGMCMLTYGCLHYVLTCMHVARIPRMRVCISLHVCM